MKYFETVRNGKKSRANRCINLHYSKFEIKSSEEFLSLFRLYVYIDYSMVTSDSRVSVWWCVYRRVENRMVCWFALLKAEYMAGAVSCRIGFNYMSKLYLSVATVTPSPPHRVSCCKTCTQR